LTLLDFCFNIQKDCMSELKVKRAIFGAIKHTSREEGSLCYLLCAKCGESTILLKREMIDIRDVNHIPTDTPIEKLVQDDCPTCNPGNDHDVRVVE
jgi:hypothetical protein